MKKRFNFLFIVTICFCFISTSVVAHPGRTDVNGGHYNQSTGEYHYHHGYPAHQHVDGVCLYDYDDKTNQGDSSNSSSSSNESTTDYDDYAIKEPSSSIITDSFDDNKNEELEAETEFTFFSLLRTLFQLIIAGVLYCSPTILLYFLFELIKILPYDDSDYKLPNPFKEKADFSSNSKSTYTKIKKERLLRDFYAFNIPAKYRHKLKEALEQGDLKIYVWGLINLGIYREYFYDILEAKVPKSNIKAYADYKAFIRND